MLTRARSHGQAGFTLVEVMVAIVILLVGILGVVSLVDGANAVTSKTKAREAGTNIARSVIEVSRSVRYRDLTTNELLAAVGTRPGLADVKPATPGYTIRSRGVDFEMALTVCSLDDPKDNLGTHPGGVVFCPDTDMLGAGEPSRDRNPDDYKRVRVTLVWKTRATEQSITQTSSIINPVGGLGPSVIGLTMTSPSSSSSDQVRIETDVDYARFAASTSTSAAELNWSVGGDTQGKADGGPINWTFQWDFDKPNGDTIYYDCTYVVQADAFDNQGRAGAPRALTVILNRRAPLAVGNFGGGRNGNGDRVDLQWTATPECDVEGYRVFRSASPATDGAQITCLDQDAATFTTETACLDDPPGPGPWYYKVRAVDTIGSGALREGDWSTEVAVGGTNDLPSVPQGLTTCVGGDLGCEGPDGSSAPSGVIVIGWDPSTDSDGNVQLYRVYRDGTAYADRHGTFFPSGGSNAWFEFAPDSSAHTYYVTAVDDDFGESAPSAGISAGPGA